MDIEIITVSFIGTVVVTLLWTLGISLELKYNRRCMPRIRSWLDRQVLRSVKELNTLLSSLIVLFRRGGGALEHDLVEPITDPVIKVSEQYRALRTGEMKLRKKPLSRISPYLQYLFQKKR